MMSLVSVQNGVGPRPPCNASAGHPALEASWCAGSWPAPFWVGNLACRPWEQGPSQKVRSVCVTTTGQFAPACSSSHSVTYSAVMEPFMVAAVSHCNCFHHNAMNNIEGVSKSILPGWGSNCFAIHLVESARRRPAPSSGIERQTDKEERKKTLTSSVLSVMDRKWKPRPDFP
jgi:hypothetical protein